MIVTSAGQNPDVVLVEDNEEEARISVMGLRRIDPRPSVLVISDGEEALHLLTGVNQLHPQVILLDLKLPKVHGLDILAAIKAEPEHQKTSVLILTSSDHPNDVDRAQALGCSEYLCKPVDWEQYVKMVCCRTAGWLKESQCPD